MRSNRDFHVVAAIACASAMVPACASAPLATDDGVREGALIGESGAFPIRYEVVDGKALFEGDILLEGSRGGNGPHAESFTLGERSAVLGRLWPNGIIPVRFDPSIDDAMKQTIAAAMVDWMTKTGLTLFVDTASSAKDYVLFQAGTGGCNSGFGYYPGVNIVNLSVGCNRLDTAVHEIGHRIGLYHEHTRPDRDQYLRVVDANISGHQDQFTPRAWGDGAMPTAFDFDSVMLYNSFTTDTSFAKDTSKPVMTKLDGTSTWVSQDGSGLSAGDVAGVAALYGASHAQPYRITSANSWNAGSGMAAVARDAGSMDTFVIGKNGGLFDAGWWSAATNHWNTPYPIGSANVWVAGGGVAAVSRTPGSIDTFVIGKDGALWNAAWSSGPGAAWNGGYAISAPRTFDAGAGIAAVCRDASSTDTFVIGSDGALWNAGWWSAATGQWHAPYRITAGSLWSRAGGVAAVARTHSTLDVLTIGMDGALWNAGWWDAATNRWNAPYKITNINRFKPGAALTAIARSASSVEVFAVDYSGSLVEAARWSPSNGWQTGLVATGAGAFQSGAGIAAASRTSTTFDVFAVPGDGATWNGGSWVVPGDWK
jgi:hypothetical protein